MATDLRFSPKLVTQLRNKNIVYPLLHFDPGPEARDEKKSLTLVVLAFRSMNASCFLLMVVDSIAIKFMAL